MTKNLVLLIRPAYSLNIYKVYGRLPRYREIRPPLGLMYIAAYLEKNGYPVRIVDAETGLLDNADLLNIIRRVNPQYLGITSTTPEFPSVKKLFEIAKEASPGIVTIAGGPHITALADAANGEYGAIDYLVSGDGEKAVLKILRERPDRKIVELENDDPLDDLPLPARDLVDYGNYKFPMPNRGLVRMDTVLTSRGCPFYCSFCFNRNTKLRYRDIGKCLDEIELSHARYGAKFIMFLDDTLTVSKKRVAQLCEGLIKRKLNKKVAFYANARADTVDFETLKMMKAAGIVEMSMGVESGNQDVLDNINKGSNLKQYEKVYSWMKKLGFETRGSFILGHPHETHRTVRDTINFAKSLPLVRASCCILTPYPGTEVYSRAKKGDGLYLLSDKWEDFTRYGRSVVRTEELTKADLENYQKVFLREFYTQPKVIFYHLLQLLKGNFSLYYYRPVIFAIKRRIQSLLQ